MPRLCFPGVSSKCQCSVEPSVPCAAGSFCTNGIVSRCGSGFFCPANSTQPVLCCEGFFCPSPIKMHPCPAGYYCRLGQKKPFPCGPLAVCPEGTVDPFLLGQLLLVILLVAVVAASSFLFGYRQRRRLSRIQSTMLELPNNGGRADPVSESLCCMKETTPSTRCCAVQCPCSSAKDTPEFNLFFENLSFSLPSGKRVFDSLSGCFFAGRLCAIMGPSGSGKTTLLSLLCGKVPMRGGSVKVRAQSSLPNREPGEENIFSLDDVRSWMAFIPQDDVMITDASVFDTIRFSAEYRLDRRWSSLQREDWTSYVLKVLGLQSVTSSHIGDAYERGISGGQRKRVNIGIELAANPSILLADEPFSGLDSTASLEVCQALRDIVHTRHAAIAVVVHQPRFEVFEMFDDVLLLDKNGDMVFSGPREQLVPHFESRNHVFPPGHNHVDIIMDIVSGRSLRTSTDDASHQDPMLHEAVLMQSPLQPSFLRKLTHQFNWWTSDVVSDMRQFFRCKNAAVWPRRQCASHWYQFFLCFIRCCRLTFGSAGRMFGEAILHVLCGLLIGLATADSTYVGSIPEADSPLLCPLILSEACSLPLRDRLTNVAQILLWGMSFAGISCSASSLGKNKPNYWREVSTGLGTFPFVFAALTVDCVRITIASFLFSLSFTAFFVTPMPLTDMFLIALMVYWNAFAIGYFLSTLIRIERVALLGVVLALLFAVLLSGTDPRLPEADVSYSWIFNISYARWAVEAFYISQIQPYDYMNVNSGLSYWGYSLSMFDIDLSVMFCIGCGWIVLCLLVLISTDRRKKK
eukprot:ANDGO_07260.mRNA.1 Putative white-brown complex homolog protein 30